MGAVPNVASLTRWLNTLRRQNNPPVRVEDVGGESPRQATPLTEIHLAGEARIPVPIAEFSRVLGGGLVPGSLVLLGGEPGIGKSTLVLELSALMARANEKVLYVSGEESARQIKLRADRMGLGDPSLYLLTETDLDHIFQQINALEPTLVVIDSIQTTRVAELDSSPGLGRSSA